ncbi:MAG: hypothetical protein AAF415_14515 [Pseudomonadota bacterium]
MTMSVRAVLASMAVAVFTLGTSLAQSTTQNTPTAAEFGAEALRLAQSELQEWITDPVILFAIREQNETYKDLTDRRVQRLDKRWIVGGPYGPMVGDLLDRQASIILRDRRELSDGLINEIIVMDAFGLNVAISDATSDFFQGDEAKWQETFLKGAEAVHISEIEFDESTQKYQSQVSVSVTDPETGEVIGAVTFGISVEKLLN